MNACLRSISTPVPGRLDFPEAAAPVPSRAGSCGAGRTEATEFVSADAALLPFPR
jgi:hypothetical protein